MSKNLKVGQPCLLVKGRASVLAAICAKVNGMMANVAVFNTNGVAHSNPPVNLPIVETLEQAEVLQNESQFVCLDHDLLEVVYDNWNKRDAAEREKNEAAAKAAREKKEAEIQQRIKEREQAEADRKAKADAAAKTDANTEKHAPDSEPTETNVATDQTPAATETDSETTETPGNENAGDQPEATPTGTDTNEGPDHPGDKTNDAGPPTSADNGPPTG